MKNLIIVGGGGHCKSVIDVAECAGYTILGILERPEEVGKNVLGYKVIGSDAEMSMYADVAEFIVAVGQIESPALRMKLHRMIEDAGGRLATIVSPTAYVSKFAEIGEGTVIMHQVVVNADAKIGRGCIINTFANIEHDVIIGDYCHISTGAIVNGGSEVGEKTFLGSRSVVNQGLTIIDSCVIASGSVVNKTINESGLYAGNPAKLISLYK